MMHMIRQYIASADHLIMTPVYIVVVIFGIVLLAGSFIAKRNFRKRFPESKWRL